MTKMQKLSNFQKLYAFCCPNFRRTLWIGTLKRVNKQRMLCPVSFSEEFIAVFRWNFLKLTPKITKNPKVSKFQRSYAFFVNVSTDFVD